MNRALFILVLYSIFISIFAFDYESAEVNSYKLAHDDELLSSIYNQFDEGYEQVAQETSANNLYAEQFEPVDDEEETKMFAWHEIKAPYQTNEIVSNLNDNIITEKYRKLAKKLINDVPEAKRGPGQNEKSLTLFLSAILWKFDHSDREWQEIFINHQKRFYNWLTHGNWKKIYNKFSARCDRSSEDDIKLLALLDKIINYEKRVVQRKRKAETERDFHEINEEDANDDSSFIIEEYGTLAKKLTSFVPGKRYIGRTEEDIELFLSYILFKFAGDIDWNAFPKTLRSQFRYWCTNGNWQKIYNDFSLMCDRSCKEDTKILLLFEKILDYADARPAPKKRRKLNNASSINGAL